MSITCRPFAVLSRLSVAVALIAGASTLAAQERSRSLDAPIGISTSVGVNKTQFPHYSNTGWGGSVAFFYQPRPLLGMQVEAGTYPKGSRFRQSPVTAGYRIGRPVTPVDAYGLRHMSPVIYIGAGASRSHDANSLNQPINAAWYPCLEGSAEFDIPYNHLSIRPVQFSFLDTITPLRQLRSYNITTGFTYRF